MPSKNSKNDKTDIELGRRWKRSQTTAGSHSKFWIDEAPPITGSYERRMFEDEPKKSFWQQNEDILTDFFLFTLLIAIGVVVFASLSELDELKDKSFYSELFFDAGYLVVVQKLLFEWFPAFWGSKLCHKCLPGLQKLTKINIILTITDLFTFILSCCFVLLGVLLDPNHPERSYGKAIFTAGFIDMIRHLVFLQPSPRVMAKKNQKKVEEMESSMARGLADGYFFNFVAPIAKALATDGSIEGKVDRIGDKTFQKLYIIVPRSVQFERGSDLDTVPKSIGRLSGRFNIDWGNSRNGRTKFLYILEDIANDPRYVNSDEKLHVFDFPTTLGSIAYSYMDTHVNPVDIQKPPSNSSKVTKYKYTQIEELLDELARGDGKLGLQSSTNTSSSANQTKQNQKQHPQQKKFDKFFKNEANIFSYRLAWRLKRNNLEEFVELIEIDKLIGTPVENDS